jgi:hypothetical protein
MKELLNNQADTAVADTVYCNAEPDEAEAVTQKETQKETKKERNRKEREDRLNGQLNASHVPKSSPPPSVAPSVQESVGRNRADSLFDSVFRSQNFQSSIASSDLDSALSYDGDGSYSDGSYSDLLALTRRLYIGCQFGPRTRSGRTFLDVSRGREIIAWLLADPLSGLPTEAAAVGRMQDAMYFGLLRRVSARDNLLNLGGSKNVFKNDFSIYKVVHSRTGASRLVCTVEGVELTRRKRGDYYVRLSCGGSRVR